MMNIIVGEREFGDGSIDEMFDHIARNRLEWFEDPFVQRIVKEIDDTVVTDAFHIKSSVFGNIPYEHLSGGVKALILLYKEPSIELWGTLCGDNCIPLMCEISKMHDITVKFTHIPLSFPEDSQAVFLDDGTKACTEREIMDGIFERVVRMGLEREEPEFDGSVYN